MVIRTEGRRHKGRAGGNHRENADRKLQLVQRKRGQQPETGECSSKPADGDPSCAGPVDLLALAQLHNGKFVLSVLSPRTEDSRHEEPRHNRPAPAMLVCERHRKKTLVSVRVAEMSCVAPVDSAVRIWIEGRF